MRWPECPFQLGDVVSKSGGESRRVVMIDREHRTIGTVTEADYLAEQYAADVGGPWVQFKKVPS